MPCCDLPLAVALGDPAGVGPEVVAAAWDARIARNLPPFFAVGNPAAIAATWRGPIARVTTAREAVGAFAHALPVLALDEGIEVAPGEPTLEGARTALTALETALGLVKSGAARALVTAPVSKSQLYAIGFTHSGQTEFIAERCGVASDNAVMMLAGQDLRVVPVTTHVALADVPRLLDVEMIVAKGRATARGLQRSFGIDHPRLAFAGLNPHAGEDGALGREEIEVIAPAIEILKSEAIDASGPFAADGLFHPRARHLRRRDVHVPRSGADPVEGALFR